ncbi:MAG: hypothetical protein NVSMB62_01400 [Acidobacteriaceae bacterium]
MRPFAAAALLTALAVSASAGDVNQTALQQASTTATKPTARKHHWYEVGIASWYGKGFQGRKTAAGERYDMNGMTCAHPTLPMGTWLKVTNLKNRQTTFVRVNDRGPIFEGRIVDLSFAAAHAVGLTGVGKVKLEAIPATDPALAQDMMAHVQMPSLFDTVRR